MLKEKDLVVEFGVLLRRVLLLGVFFRPDFRCDPKARMELGLMEPRTLGEEGLDM